MNQIKRKMSLKPSPLHDVPWFGVSSPVPFWIIVFVKAETRVSIIFVRHVGTEISFVVIGLYWRMDQLHGF